MAQRPTDYERVSVIVSRELKREFIRWCESHDITLTQAVRATIRNLLDKKEFVLCQTKKKKPKH